MPDGSIDPESLEGDALGSWYMRSPAEIEQERQAAAAKRYQDFFYGSSGTDPDPGFAREMLQPDHDVDPGFAMSFPSLRPVAAQVRRQVFADGGPARPPGRRLGGQPSTHCVGLRRLPSGPLPVRRLLTAHFVRTLLQIKS